MTKSLLSRKAATVLAGLWSSCAVASGLPFSLSETAPTTVGVPESVTSGTSANVADNSIKVRGRITDKSGNALIGARVSTADNKSMTITDVDGNFALEIPADGMTKIEVSYLGMQPLQFTVNGKQDKPIELVMADDVHQLNEVFVTGYQTITRERSTGAYDMLKGNVLDKPAVNIAQRLVGTVAGIHSTQDANGNVSMTVRGQGTFLPSSPLVVIDGFATTEGLSSINPNDVENITVLKDAAASSIWGARASNGVIVVTTKKAKKSQPLQITFSSFLKIGAKTDLAYLRNLASSAQQVDYEESIFGKYGYSALSPEVSPGNFKNGYFRHFTQGQMLYNQYANGYITEDEMKAGLSRLRSLDNSRQIEDAFLRRPITQQYNLSVQGGSDRMRNYLSVNYNYDSSRFKRTHDSSLQADYRGSIAATKWLDVDVAAMLRYVNSNMSGANVSMIRELGPYDMLRNSDGSLADMSYSQWYTPMIDAMVPKEDFPYTDWTYNPIREIQNRELTRKTMTNRVQAGLTFKLTDGLTFNTKLQYERADAKDRSLYGENTWMVRRTVNTTSTWNMATGNVTPNMPLGGFLDESNILTTSYDFRNQLDFSHMFGQWLQLSAIAGFELMQNRVEVHDMPRTVGYDDDHLTVGIYPDGVGNVVKDWAGRNISFQTAPYIHQYGYSTDRFVSMYGNIGLTFLDKYSITGSVRTDASNFITDIKSYRYSPFWSVGLGWNTMKEAFMADYKWIDYLKLRATFGYNGNSSNATSVKTLITMNGVNPESGYMEAEIVEKGNPYLRWEKTSTFNLGVDFDLFAHRLYGKIDYYYKHGRDILADISVQLVNGATSAYFNNAEIKNQGIEATIGTSMNILQDLTWNGSLTFAYNKNKVQRLLVTTAPYWWLTGSGGTVYIEGKPFNSLWAFRYGGVQNVGTGSSERLMPVVKLIGEEVMPFGGSTTYDGLDFMAYQGTTVPPYTLGFSNELNWKAFTMSFILTGEFGHKFRRTGFNYAGEGTFANAQITEVWGKSNPAVAPMPLQDNDVLWPSDFTGYMDYLTANANNVRLQELNLTYRLPASVLKTLGMVNAMVYIQGNNLLTLKALDEDPLYHYGSLRLQPSTTLGVKLTF